MDVTKQNYEELASEDAAVGQIVPCRVPEALPPLGQPSVLTIPIIDFLVITKEQAIDAFKDYVASTWCWDHNYMKTLRVCDVSVLCVRLREGRNGLLLPPHLGFVLRGAHRVLEGIKTPERVPFGSRSRRSTRALGSPLFADSGV